MVGEREIMVELLEIIVAEQFSPLRRVIHPIHPSIHPF
jgi:hypothetical protein